MAQTAAHLADQVIPPVPVRQWVISVPKRLRGMLADRPNAVAALTKIFLAAIERLLLAAPGGPSPHWRSGGDWLVFRRNRCLSPAAAGGDWLVFRRNRCLSPAAGKKGQPGKRDRHRLLRSRSQSLPRHLAMPKAKLMARLGEEFPLECPACGGDIRLISFITEPGPIRKILTHLGEPLEPPPVSPARGPPTDWAELVQVHDDRDIFHRRIDELPAIDIHSL